MAGMLDQYKCCYVFYLRTCVFYHGLVSFLGSETRYKLRKGKINRIKKTGSATIPGTLMSHLTLSHLTRSSVMHGRYMDGCLLHVHCPCNATHNLHMHRRGLCGSLNKRARCRQCFQRGGANCPESKSRDASIYKQLFTDAIKNMPELGSVSSCICTTACVVAK